MKALFRRCRWALPPPNGLRWLRKAAVASAGGGVLGARLGAGRGRQGGQHGWWKNPFDFPILVRGDCAVDDIDRLILTRVGVHWRLVARAHSPFDDCPVAA
jgi:hypothetical protein